MSRENDVAVDVDIACDYSGIPTSAAIEGWITSAIRAARPDARYGIEVSVRVVDRDEIQTLNRDYRQCDRATNVLSFPTGDIAGLPDDAPRILGDIVACAPVIAAEAASQGKVPNDHWAHMIVHGALHLLGYEHEDEDDATTMEALEVAILADLGIADPYVLQTDTIG